MSGESYSKRELTAIGAFTVASVLIGVGAYQLGFNLSGGRSVGAEMVAASAPAPVSGQSLYASNCAGCHGGKGEGGVGPALASSAGWPLADFSNSVLNGQNPDRELSPVMPRFAVTGLDGETATDEQVKAIHDYLGTLK